ncbi:hypothetical protein [Leifsonia sp. Leaf264]|uniref:hypothetical protein n=1 Tax=Leifsonia sp. Leaf264 TaxID=1736314 RepID=UPI0006FA87E7|nr:hypothetical protein [Leifsonia sp. Leaf264]KQO98595.1 hypothetical protein ASF30_11070 [Leifsonia sp. Leaf264]
MTKLLPYFSYETISELDYDGGIGSTTGILIDGHLDLFEVECFLARDAEEEFYDAPSRGFDVEHVYWRTEPYAGEDGDNEYDSYVYVWDKDDSKGGKPATKLEIETTWDRRCVNHEFEVAKSGVPIATIVESQHHLADDHGYIYLCEDCATSYDARLKAARIAAIAELSAAMETVG